MGHDQPIAIHVEHGDHVLRAVAVNLAHERRAARRHAKRYLNRLPLGVFSQSSSLPSLPVGGRISGRRTRRRHTVAHSMAIKIAAGAAIFEATFMYILLKFICSCPGSWRRPDLPSRGRTRLPQMFFKLARFICQKLPVVLEPRVDRLERLGIELDKNGGVRCDVRLPVAPFATGASVWRWQAAKLGNASAMRPAGCAPWRSKIEHGAAGGIGQCVKSGLGRICNRTVPHNA